MNMQFYSQVVTNLDINSLGRSWLLSGIESSHEADVCQVAVKCCSFSKQLFYGGSFKLRFMMTSC